jgi:UDP-glucose 4-epimerase
MRVFVTGGAGYVGSHTLVELLQSNHEVIVYDNLCNSSQKALLRVQEITNQKITFIKGDTRDFELMCNTLGKYNCDAVIHFAGLKAVGESNSLALEYYDNNVSGTVTLLKAMDKMGIEKLVFSSSATVYGGEVEVPYREESALGSTSSPYGTTKSVCEKIIFDWCQSNKNTSAVILRYFNPIGAHPSGLIGEDPKGIPNNLLPYISQVAIGYRDKLKVFGCDYPTEDGTCRRDYLHVVDLANGHLASLEWMRANENFKGAEVFNLGTGSATSVMEIIRAFEEEINKDIPFEFVTRRQGDLPEFWAEVTKAKSVLGWEAKLNLSDMLRDTWNWQLKNPKGFK